MRQVDKKYFGDVQSGRLNSDDSPFVVGTNEWVNAENVRTGSTDKGFTGIVESVGGNIELPEPPSAKIYYFNVDYSTGGYNQLGTSPSTSQFNYKSLSNTNTIDYLTDIGNPNVTSIVEGNWLLNLVLINYGSITTPIVYAEIGIYYPGNIFSVIAKTNSVSITNTNINSNSYVTYNLQATIPQKTLSSVDRIGVRITGTNISPGSVVLFIPQSASSPNNYYNILTTNIGSASTYYDYTTIGSVEDTENKRIIYFNYDNSINRLDRIVCYYTESNKQYNVLLTSQVEGGLNFDKNSLIHSAKISGENILSWVEGKNNEPRKINMESAIVANDSSFDTNANPYSFPLNFSEITLIKRPPIFPPIIEKKQNVLFLNNLIQYQSFEFAFQYEYYDSEISVVSSYSVSSRINDQSYIPASSEPNYIYVAMQNSEKIPNTVRRINLISRIGSGNNIGGNNANIIKVWDKENSIDADEIRLHNNGTLGFSLNYSFYNNITGETIASDDVLRPFDNVPIFSQTHEVSKNRFFLGNNTEGYDTPKSTSLQVGFSNIVNIDSPVQVQALYYVVFQTSYSPPADGQWTYSGWAVFVTINNQQGWYTVKGYEQFSQSVTGFTPNVPPPTLNVNNFRFICSANDIDSYCFGIRDWINNVDSGFSSFAWQYPYLAFNPSSNTYDFNVARRFIYSFYATQIGITGLNNKYYNIFPQLSSYKFGIVFYDYAMRKCGVAPRTNTGLQLFYSFNSNIEGFSPHTVSVYEDLRLYILPNDTIIISGTSIDGTYTVVSVSYDLLLSKTDILVTQSVTSSVSSPGIIEIYRYSTQDLTTPSRAFDYNQALGAMKWELNNSNSLLEIPDWAYYYSIVRTLNLRTRFFLQGINTGIQIKYATKDADGNYRFDTIFNLYTTTGVAIDASSLSKAGLGYTYEDGSEDICILTKNDTNSTQYRIPVIAQSGNYIILQPEDLGTFGALSLKYIFEIYTPYKTSIQEPYYEMGNICQIVNPKTSNRSYSTLSGYFNADTYMFIRNWLTETYNANAMSPNDLYWKRWDTDSGKVNIITILGQINKNTNITWSDTYVSGTQINGSSTFRLGSETFVSDDCGSITKLQLTSKVQDQGQGSVMLALCNSEINSMYLGETQISDSTGKTQFFSASTNVISTINILKGNYGCINPESVVQYRGKVYFVDISNGRVVQYSDNGLDAISNVKMSRFWKNWSYKYQSLNIPSIININYSIDVNTVGIDDNVTIDFTSIGSINEGIKIKITLINILTNATVLISVYTTQGGESLIELVQELYLSMISIATPNLYGISFGGTASVGQLQFSFLNSIYKMGLVEIIPSNQIELLGDRPFIFSTVDSGHDELLISLPKLSNTPPKGYLPDYPSTVYPFDTLDYQGKTMVYCLGSAAQVYPHWQGAFTFTTENFVTLQNRLFSFKNGNMYEHNQGQQNTFYGVYSPSKIMFTSNIMQQVPKVYDNLLVESNLMPNFVYFYNNYPYIQTSDLTDIDFRDVEGIWYASILRNKIVPTATGFTTDGLLTAEVMRNTNMYVETRFSPTSTPLELRLLQLGMSISKGHPGL